MFQPMNKMEEGWHEPQIDLVDMLEQAENTLISRHSCTEWYDLNKPAQTPYTEEELKSIKKQDAFAHFIREEPYFCKECNKEIFPHLTGRPSFCDHTCAKANEARRKREYQQAIKLRNEEWEQEKLERKRARDRERMRRIRARNKQNKHKKREVRCVECNRKLFISYKSRRKFCDQRCGYRFRKKQEQREAWREENRQQTLF